MLQVHCYEIEQSILNHESLSDSTFVPNHFTNTLCNRTTSYLCHIVFQITSDVAY